MTAVFAGCAYTEQTLQTTYSQTNGNESESGLHRTKNPVTTMLTYPWKCTVLHRNHLGNTWKPLVLMTRHFDYCPSASEGDNQSVRSSAPVVSRCFPGGYDVKLCISRDRLAWWLLAFFAQCYVHEPERRVFMLGGVSYVGWPQTSGLWVGLWGALVAPK